MAILRTMQPAFTAGELSPALWARVDLSKYQSGLKIAKNVFVHPHGGASNRTGLEFIGRVRGSGFSVLIPFVYDAETDQTYNLEFSHLKMRVYRAGAPILRSAKNITAITTANPAVVTSAAHGYANGQEVFLAGVGGTTALNGRNFIIRNATTNTFTLEDLLGNAVSTVGMPAYVSGGTTRALYEIDSPYTSDQVSRVCFAQENDVVYLTHQKHAPRKLSRLADDNWAFSIPSFSPSIGPPGAPSVSQIVNTAGAPGYQATTYSYKVASVSELNGEESLPSGAGSTVNDLDIAKDGQNGKNRIAWGAVGGAARYIVYKEDNGVFGYIGGTVGTYFDDENITADLSNTPQAGYNPFASAGNYPATVNFFEQRLALAGTENIPSGVWLGQSANYENFGAATPAKASDAITFRVKSKEKNSIRALGESRGLAVFTSANEFNVSGGSEDFLSPSQTVVKKQSNRGSSFVQPIAVGDVMLFNVARGGVIRDYSYEFSNDNFTGKDLTIMSRHLFEGRRVISWAYAQAPYSIVWVILDNGQCVSLTYMREHDVWAWTQHETNGVFECVNVVPEGDEDAVYFVVRRTVQGVDHRYIERLHTRMFTASSDAFFVDSGLTYEGPAIKSLRGLYHLEGKAVVALADGNVVKDLVVSNGTVTLPIAAAKIHVGLPFEAIMKTLDIDLGSVQGMGLFKAGRSRSQTSPCASNEPAVSGSGRVKTSFMN
ncbi:hypothetical protein [Rhizobium oryzihabitans]|uniref:hypothetical protein n=1 Tax=Rhizobium oryzihabitans TaxID=2267833 RepID=UPI0013DCFA35|nr:hypothetical protein [Rhizobium oryzihabitans]